MAKRYLSLDEAAQQLALTTEQLMKLREQGEIRGFADRGSWKFREQDIEEFLRSQQADSSPDIPIMRDSSSSVLEEAERDLSSSDSDVRLFFDESVFGDDDANSFADSGSDVRLVGDSGPELEAENTGEELDLGGWDSDVKRSDSDSDVKLVSGPHDSTEADLDLGKTSRMSDSDSEVLLASDSHLQLSDSDSDVRLAEGRDLSATGPMNLTDPDSDSDVKLKGSDVLFRDDSGSDVQPPKGKSRVGDPAAKTIALPIIPDDSDLKLLNKGSGVRQPQPDSGITLEVRGSGIGLDADESGISLEMDSGISLDADDSGISLESFDSGARIGEDSGISLEAGDSGISLDLEDDSGISLQPKDKGKTMPMQSLPGSRTKLPAVSGMTTRVEVPGKPPGKDSEFELAGLDDDDDTSSNTSVLTFEDSSGSLPTIATRPVTESDVEDAVEEDEGYSDEEYEDSEDLDDIHDAEDFGDEDFEAGQSQVGGFQAGARTVSRVEADWGMLTKGLIAVSTVVSILCAVIGIELVRTMWLWTQPGTEAEASSVLKMIGGMF